MFQQLAEPRMPRLMSLGMWFAAIYPFGAVALVLLALAGIGDFNAGDYRMDQWEWLRVAGPLLLLTGAEMAAIAYGLRTAKPWSRHLVMIMWASLGLYGLVIGIVGAVPPVAVMQMLARAIVFGGIAAWYFYYKPNVVAYFASLREG